MPDDVCIQAMKKWCRREEKLHQGIAGAGELNAAVEKDQRHAVES